MGANKASSRDRPSMTTLRPVHRPRTRSLFLQEALELEPIAGGIEPVSGRHRADICIVGGGYLGLWTALRLKEIAPSLEVILLEADICGAGASGRNGGFALSWWSKLRSLVHLCGESEGLRLARAAADAVSEIGLVCQRHGIDAHFRQAGWLWAATAPVHIGAWDQTIRACEQRGIDVFQRLSPDAVAERTGSAVHLAGVWEPTAASIQPAMLARGLRRVAIEHGVRIFEHSPVTELTRGRSPAVHTQHGVVEAERIILAINAWAAVLPELRRAILPMASDIVATTPMPDRLSQSGWTGGECISDARLMVHYYRTTHDGRIAFGRGGACHALLGRVSPAFENPGSRVKWTERAFRRVYPAFADVPITDRCTGAVDRSETNTPFFGRLSDHPNVLYGVGFSGTGVAQTLLGANILAATALGIDNEWSRSPLNRGPASMFPPDPVRFFGGILVRAAVRRKEHADDRDEAAGPLTNHIARLAPSGMMRGSTPNTRSG